MMTSTMACFGAALMISLAEPDLKEPLVPEPWEEAKDTQGAVVKNQDGTTKQVDKNPVLFRMEIALYTDAVKIIRKKRDEWLDIRAKIFHLVFQHSPPSYWNYTAPYQRDRASTTTRTASSYCAWCSRSRTTKSSKSRQRTPTWS